MLAADFYEQGLPVRDYYTRCLLNRINALPSGNVYHPVQIEAQQDVSHVRQMYLSTSLFDNAVIVRGSFQALRVTYRHTHGVRLLWKKKDTSHVFLRLHSRDMSQLIASQWSRRFVLEQRWQDTIWQHRQQHTWNRTPTSTLHRVFHRSLTTIKRMTTILKHLTLPPHHHHHIHQMYLCLMILIRRIPAFHLMMMIHFTHHFNHHQDRMMTHQMRKCSHHQTYHLIHHHHQIIHNHCFPEPNPYLSRQTPLSCQTQSIPPNIDDTPMTHSTKRPPDDPPIPPATEARPSQMPASSSSQFHPSNHLGGDTQPSVTRNATTQPAVVAPSVF